MATGNGGTYANVGRGRKLGKGKPGGNNSYRASQTKSMGKLGLSLRHGAGGKGGKRSGQRAARAR